MKGVIIMKKISFSTICVTLFVSLTLIFAGISLSAGASRSLSQSEINEISGGQLRCGTQHECYTTGACNSGTPCSFYKTKFTCENPVKSQNINNGKNDWACSPIAQPQTCLADIPDHCTDISLCYWSTFWAACKAHSPHGNVDGMTRCKENGVIVS